MKSSFEQERELSFKLLSEARTKKAGYDSQATRRKLCDSVTALCPTIKPYGWQIDVSEALALGLDATVIAGTGSGKTLPWAMPLLLEENRDRICLVISPLNELEADHVWQRLSLGIVDLTMTLLFLGSIFHREAQNTRGRR
jgi:ATP-dependent helicase YprA (DUF1998 family)